MFWERELARCEKEAAVMAARGDHGGQWDQLLGWQLLVALTITLVGNNRAMERQQQRTKLQPIVWSFSSGHLCRALPVCSRTGFPGSFAQHHVL